MAKRALDLVAALAALVVALPLMIAVAIAVKLDSQGPIFYRDRRVGRGGRVFLVYKFRSMKTRDEPGSPITGGEDTRVTRVGRLLRLLRLDEVPQLLNVLFGQMSLVGPRPEAPAIVDRYTAEQREILSVRPGLTGPTQLMWLDEAGMFPPGVDPEQYYITHILPQKVQSDLRYVRTRTLRGDLRYLVQTPFVLAHLAFARARVGRTLKVLRLAADVLLVVAATYAAFLVRFDGSIPPQEQAWLRVGAQIAISSYGLAFFVLRTYRSLWRYAGVEDFWHIVRASLLGAAIMSGVMYGLRAPYPRTILVLTPVLALLFMAGARLVWRTAVTVLGRRWWLPERRRVVIVGAGLTGESIAREIRARPSLGYEVVGFADDDARLRDATLHSVPVLGGTRELGELTRRYQLDEAIIAIPRIRLPELRRITQACTDAGLEFKTLPSVAQLLVGEGQLRYLRKVEPGELLGRAPLNVKPERLAAFLRDKRVMVTGAGGSIGSELCRQIAGLGAEALLMVERAENALFEISGELHARGARTHLTAALADVKHVPRMAELFETFKPDLVFHAAAYKHVPILETHPTEAILNNVVGTARLARLAAAYGTQRFVFISTDKAVKPHSLMGATKRIGELYLMALNTRGRSRGEACHTQFRVVRFGNVLGSNGSALPLFQRQVESGAPITITDPQVSRFFMTIQEAVALVLESVQLDSSSDILVLDMGEPVKITKLADDLVAALGLAPSAVAREIVGLRPGEKLHESLWEDVDEVRRSAHPRVVAVRHRGRPVEEMEAYVRDLERLALAGDAAGLVQKVHEVVPTYRPPSVNGGPSIMVFGPAASATRLRDASGGESASNGRTA